MIQIGARNMQNFTLLRRAGRSSLPVLVKRGLAATLDEWLLAAEYIMSEGNYNVVLCERGVAYLRPAHAQHARSRFHPGGATHFAPARRRRSFAWHRQELHGYSARPAPVWPVGADGLIVEVHDQPEKALVGRRSGTDTRAIRSIDSGSAANSRGRRAAAGQLDSTLIANRGSHPVFVSPPIH